MNSFSLRIHHYIQPCICLGEGRVQQSVKFIAPYIEKFCSIIVFGKFSCGTYVIVVFNSDIVVFPNLRNLFLIGSAIFSMVLSNQSIFLCGVTVFRIPLAAFSFYFLRMGILRCKTGFDTVLLCPVAVLEKFTKQYFHDLLLCA